MNDTDSDNHTDETDEALWEAFRAGFEITGEGYNAEYGADDEDVRQRFEEWRCTGHEYTPWEFVGIHPPVNRELYRRVCIHCGRTEQTFDEPDVDDSERDGGYRITPPEPNPDK